MRPQPSYTGSQTFVLLYKFLNHCKGSFNNYVDMIKPFFDHLPTSTWAGFTLNVEKNWHFWTTYPPHHVHIVIEQSLTVQRELTNWGIFCKYGHVCQTKGEPGQAPVPIPPLKQTNKVESQSMIDLFSREFFSAVLLKWFNFYHLRQTPFHQI
jgi:hypothetical protein